MNTQKELFERFSKHFVSCMTNDEIVTISVLAGLSQGLKYTGNLKRGFLTGIAVDVTLSAIYAGKVTLYECQRMKNY